ncbi:hypothetical protein Tco_1501293 [Tanacetum coccineum]
MYEGSMKQLEEFQDNLMKPLEARLDEIDADFTRFCIAFPEINFHRLLNGHCGTKYMEALGNAFGRAIEKGMQEGLAAGIEHGQAGRCLSDLEAYNPSAEVDFNSACCCYSPTTIDAGKNKDVSALSVFAGSSSSDRTGRTLSLFTGRSGSEFAAGSIHARENADVNLQEVYVPEWSVTKGFELNDGRSCANMIDYFTPPAFFKTVCGMEHEQLFAEFNVSAARNLSLSSKVRMRAEYNILEKIRWKSFAKEKDNLLQVKDKEIEELRSQLLQAKDESMEVTSLESIIVEKDRGLSDLGASSSSLRSQNQSELETSSTDLHGKLEMYEGSMKQLKEFQDNLMKPLEARLAEIDADFTRCCMHFQENFHPHLLNAIAGRRWLLTHGMKLLMAKCLNSTEYMEALGDAFGRAIEKGMQEGLAARIEHGQEGRCLSDLEAYNPSAEADFNSVVRDLRGLDFPLLRELFAKKDASTWDVMDLLRLDDAVAEVLGMTDLQPDVALLLFPPPNSGLLFLPARSSGDVLRRQNAVEYTIFRTSP